MRENSKGWNTEDEIATLDYLASTQARWAGKDKDYEPTKAEAKRKVQHWLKWADKRKWPRSVDVAACKNYAQALVKGT